MIPIFTFYSYKGGSGRSTTLLNTIKYLVKDLDADQNHPILVVDADLESAGLTYFFGHHNKFDGPLNSGNVLREIDGIITPSEEGVVFGNDDEEDDMIPCSMSAAWARIVQLDDVGHTYGMKPSEVFKDLTLPAKYFISLDNIVRDFLEDNSTHKDRDILKLKDTLKRIVEDGISADEKSKMMADATIDFLPARKFLDITRFFDKGDDLKPGTVKFLGTDVSAESRVESGDAAISVEILRKKCEKHGYRAIVFDSGSGTQSSAYILHATSDVIVYCMRPTLQFIEGTLDVLFRYNQLIQENADDDENKKSIILFPNAVPDSSVNDPLCADSFNRMSSIARVHEDIVDGTFCTMDTCLHEVPLFKWRETVLGCFKADPNSSDYEVEKTVEKFSDDLQATKPFTDVYKKLSKCLVKNA